MTSVDETVVLGEQDSSDWSISVVEAIARVMKEVQSLGKDGEFNERGVRYRFRGIDAVMNAVGPALRRHGVIVVPWVEDVQQKEYTSTTGSRMMHTVVTVLYRIYGPRGDHVEAKMIGEKSNTGDKSIAQANSVALRTLLLQLLCIPTDEPDPDMTNYEIAGDERVNGEGKNVSRDELVSTVTSISSELRDLLGSDDNSWNVWIANICQQDFAIDVARRDTQENVLSVDFGKLRNNQLVRAHERLRQKLNQEKVARGEL